jgi:hypothetical protein
MSAQDGVLAAVLAETIGSDRADRLFKVLRIPEAVKSAQGPDVSRAVLAQSLNMLLFEDLLQRVPAARTYADHVVAQGRTILHDHGAIRTVAMEGMGGLPAGKEAILRILRPLGYGLHGVYPLERLKMTGTSFAQVDFPEEIAQFFISELHPERFSPEFQAAVMRVTSTSVDPLSAEAKTLLEELEGAGSLCEAKAVDLLRAMVCCFGRQHVEPYIEDYQALLAESPEMAWISTEGNAFNHATDRVEDVDKLAAEQKALGQPMKAAVETSQSGRVRQTAFLAAQVVREFRTADGGTVEKTVPGSFYEFITRLPLPDEGKLDLSFDSSNAQAIFKMTAGAAS